MKILFLGNSHTYYNDMPQIFANICKERGKDVDVAMQAQSGVTYGWHYGKLIELRFALMYGGYDYIIMQQAAHSPCPSKEETLADGMKIIELARRYGVVPIQTMPWAEKRSPEHQYEMYEIYEELAEKAGVRINPVGRIFEDIFNNYPEINMYWLDGEHASEYGSYAAALCTYATIFAESVKGVSPKSYYTYPLSQETWNEISRAYAEAAACPCDSALAKKADALWNEKAKPVLDEKEAERVLDTDKAEIIQELVDKYAL